MLTWNDLAAELLDIIGETDVYPTKEKRNTADDIRKFLGEKRSQQADHDTDRVVPSIRSERGDNCSKVYIDIPGAAKEHISATVDNKTRVVELSAPREDKQCQYSCRFSVGESYDIDKITSVYENGVIAFTIPKKEEEKSIPRKLSID